MSQLLKKFIGADQVGASKIDLENNTALRSRNAANTADVNLLKANASDEIELVAATIIDTATKVGTATTYWAGTGPAILFDNATPAIVQTKDDPAGTAGMYIASGKVSSSGSGEVDIVTGDNSGTGTTGLILINSGAATTGDSGHVNINSGGTTTGNSGHVQITTGGPVTSGNSGIISLTTGDSPDANSGNLVLATGTAVGTRGHVTVNAAYLDMSSTKIQNLATPTVGTDAATKAYVDSVVVAGESRNKENITLSSTDITNQYVDLAHLILANSLDIVVSGLIQTEGTDYTLSTVGGVTRVTFAGDLATGGNAALVAGDIVHAKYEY